MLIDLGHDPRGQGKRRVFAREVGQIRDILATVSAIPVGGNHE
jgi:hypothetical protein